MNHIKQYTRIIIPSLLVLIVGLSSMQVLADTQGKGNANSASKKAKAQSRKKLESLKKQPTKALLDQASDNDPLASLALAHQYSTESQSLAAIPVLANSAAEDTIRWYNLSARLGALQKRSVDGLGTKPLRAVRKRHKKR